MKPGSTQREEELHQTERLASIGQNVSFVAHELRNPLQRIHLNTDILRMELGNDDGKVEAFDQIYEGIQQLKIVISDILDYSKRVTLNHGSLAVRDLVSKALEATACQLQRVSVTIDLEQGEQKVSVDISRMVRLLVNLISNAADAMADGGNLTIRSRFLNREGERRLSLSVIDTGCGIERENIQRVLEPFVTTKPNGIGLGLPICRRIVEEHRGTMTIASKVNQGTTVEVTIPAEGQP
ncbi:MAG: hypothetical protein Kow0099_32560 [Candidatus Abyssubacteria bacterium]